MCSPRHLVKTHYQGQNISDRLPTRMLSIRYLHDFQMPVKMKGKYSKEIFNDSNRVQDYQILNWLSIT